MEQKQIKALQILGLSGMVTNAEIKKAYRRLAQRYHPDKNPTGTDMMKMINVAYESVKDLNNVQVANDPKIANYPQALEAALKALQGLDLSIEVCGIWIWISGDTKPHRSTLKDAGYLWSPKKCMWYFRPAEARCFRGRGQELSMEEIRIKYGTEKPRRQGNLSLPAC